MNSGGLTETILRGVQGYAMSERHTNGYMRDGVEIETTTDKLERI
jgi:hypothetical protein